MLASVPDLGLTGNPVRIGGGPAAVTDVFERGHCECGKVARESPEPEDLPTIVHPFFSARDRGGWPRHAPGLGDQENLGAVPHGSIRAR